MGRATGSTARGAIIGAAVGGAAGALIASRMRDKVEILQERLPNAEVEQVSEGILVTFESGILFGFDSSQLRPCCAGPTASRYTSPKVATLYRHPTLPISRSMAYRPWRAAFRRVTGSLIG